MRKIALSALSLLAFVSAASAHDYRLAAGFGGGAFSADANQAAVFTYDQSTVKASDAVTSLNTSRELSRFSFTLSADAHYFVYGIENVQMGAGLFVHHASISAEQTEVINTVFSANDMTSLFADTTAPASNKVSFVGKYSTKAVMSLIGPSVFAQFDAGNGLKPYVQLGLGAAIGAVETDFAYVDTTLASAGFSAPDGYTEVTYADLTSNDAQSGKYGTYAKLFANLQTVKTNNLGLGFYAAIGTDFLDYFTVKGYVAYTKYHSDPVEVVNAKTAVYPFVAVATDEEVGKQKYTYRATGSVTTYGVQVGVKF